MSKLTDKQIDEAIRRAGYVELTIGAIGPRSCRRCGRLCNYANHDGGYINGGECGTIYRCHVCRDELCEGPNCE